MSFLAPEMSSIPAPVVPEQAAPQKQPIGQKPKAKSQTTTFLGGDSTPSTSQMGAKTLLGQ